MDKYTYQEESEKDVEKFLSTAMDLDFAGLIWEPEIGDEVAQRNAPQNISILIDPEGMALAELRSTYVWLPNTEQIIAQLEAKQAVLFHAGLELEDSTTCYKTFIQTPIGPIQSKATTLRTAMALSLLQVIAGGVH